MGEKSVQMSIRMRPETEQKIEERAGDQSKSAILERDLTRYYDAIAADLRNINLSLNEACLICDLMNGTLIISTDARMLWAEVLDGDEYDQVGNKWGVDAKALAARLKQLSLGQCLAIVDAAERFWAGPYRDMDTREGVATVFGIGGDRIGGSGKQESGD